MGRKRFEGLIKRNFKQLVKACEWLLTWSQNAWCIVFLKDFSDGESRVRVTTWSSPAKTEIRDLPGATTFCGSRARR